MSQRTVEQLEFLRTFGSTRQVEYIDAVIKNGSIRAAARSLNLADTTIGRSLDALEKKLENSHPENKNMVSVMADGLSVKGTSTLIKDGKYVMQWVKTNVDDVRRQELMREAIEAMKDEIPVFEPTTRPDNIQDDIIPWINIGDAHIGLLSHFIEVGENFDLKIAENELCGAISILIDEMPNCERMVINDLGDATHYENMSATTEASGHLLDYDSRFPKMIRVYSRIMRFIVEKALTKAVHVDVIINQGNHSRTNDIWMAELLRVKYEPSGRVHVLDNDSVFIAYRMGKTLVMTHHSDKCKPKMLADVMITDFKKDYGETEFHYIDIGHVHHGSVMKEYPSIFIESFNHLAALDRYAHDNGWRNRKSISMIMRSKTYGEVGRRVLPIQEIRDKLYGLSHNMGKIKDVYSV